MEPIDLGAEVVQPADIRVGNTYYFRDSITPYTKLRLTRIFPFDGFSMNIVGITEAGQTYQVGVYPGNPNWMSKLYFINPKALQREVGKLFTLKTPISSKPGKGPANIVRSFLGVQPTSGGRKKRTINTRKTRKTRKSNTRR